MIFRGGDQVDELPHLCLITCLVEELEKVNVITLLPKMVLDKMVDGRLEHERIVYSDEPDFRFLVPAWLSSAGERRIHDIVRNEEEGLQLCDLQKRTMDYPIDGWGEETDELYTPTKDGCFLVLILGQGCALEDLQRVYDGKAPVKLSAWYVIVEILSKVRIRWGVGR